ncbi:MBL fold metallo-hydrolase [Octadecabacter sp.]|nr:MBL fold metallo-hydrolase [Octadecabacter sp.]
MNIFKTGFLAAVAVVVGSGAQAAMCMDVILTGTQGGPPVFNGLAGAGTLVTYGDEADNCRGTNLQFDAGRGTVQRLSQVGMPAGQIDAIFITHVHSDHVDGFGDLMQLRWHFNSSGPKVDVGCSADVQSPAGHTMSCTSLTTNIGDAYIASGEMAQRLLENDMRLEGGPSDLINLVTRTPSPEPSEIWRDGDVVVSAIASRHVPGHLSYRVDTPAGSVVIGGDAGNDTPAPPRDTSTSSNVEKLAQGADVIVHSTIHPVMGPDRDSGFPPPVFFRQATAADLGDMAMRAGAAHLMLTHLIPPLGAARQGPYPIPGGALTEAHYEDAARNGGYDGNVIVGTDLATVRLVAE